MNTAIVGLLAETSIHPGAGQSSGFVDLPVAREAATDYPVIVGSSLKGALRDRSRLRDSESTTHAVFGLQDNAGNLVVSDARLLLLPVRSLNGHYRWITCPHILERLERDLRRAGEDVDLGSIPHAAIGQAGQALGPNSGKHFFLEERQFLTTAPVSDGVISALAEMMPHEPTANRLASQLVVLNDDDFAWFARYGLAVNARNVLDQDTKQSNNLWYEETIPPDSLFYAVFAERGEEALAATRELLTDGFLQVGGNATVGQGWFAVQWRGGDQ